MAETSSIEWTDATWNPVTGCSVVSPGCTNCYAMRLAGTRLQHHPSRAGLTAQSKAGPVWNGQVRFNAEWLDQPLRWRRPRRIFVGAHGDLFHDDVPIAVLDMIFAVMALSRRHTFQVLTKRADRMRAYVTDDETPGRVIDAALRLKELPHDWDWPLPNVWKGVSAEDQVRADERIPHLLATPAAVRFVSLEPLLGPVDLDYMFRHWWPKLDWVIAGGESGASARPMHPDWVRQIRDDCDAAGVPFLFKQWGEWTPGENVERHHGIVETAHLFNGAWDFDRENLAATDGTVDDEPDLYRIGKKAAGRRLDGVTDDAFPVRRAPAS